MKKRVLIFCLLLALFSAGVPFSPSMAMGEVLTTDQSSYYLEQTLTLIGSGFSPWSAVALSLRYEQTLVFVDQITCNGAGTFTATILVASSWSYGSYLAMAVPGSGEQATANFTVIPRGQLVTDRNYYLPNASASYTGTGFPSGIAKTLFVAASSSPTTPLYTLPTKPIESTFTGTFLVSNGWAPGHYFFVATYPTTATVTAPFTVVPIPPIPSGLAAVAGHNLVSLTWNAVGNPYQAGYKVYRSTFAGGPYTPIGQTSAVTFTDTGAPALPTPYFYVITSFDSTPFAYESGTSGEASATPWGDIHHLVFSPVSSPQTAGVSFPLTITAKDSYGRTVADYGNPAFLSDTTNSIRPLLFSFIGGIGQPSVTITKAQAGVIITATGSPTGSSNPFDVLHNTVERVALDPKTTEVTADQSLIYHLTAFDVYGNPWAVESDPGASFSILPSSGGSFNGNLLIPKIAGPYLITGAYGGQNDSGTLIITHGVVTQLVLTPSLAAIPAGASQSYIATAFDAKGNVWDVSGTATFTIDPAAGGTWSANSYTAQKAGSWVVSANFGGKTCTASLLVTHAGATLVALAPKTATIAAGAAQVYFLSASDAYGNSWDVTPSALFSIDTAAGGFWSGNRYTAERAGTWTINASLSGLTENGQLTVLQSSLNHITLAPQTATLLAGASQAYLVTAFDNFGNAWDASTSASFSTSEAAEGFWSGNLYTAAKTGAWTITSSYGGKTATASLQVVPSALHHFLFSPIASPQISGVPFSIGILAMDAFENVKTDFNGTTQMAASNGPTTPSVAGSFVQGGWSGLVAVDNSGEAVCLEVSDGSATGASSFFSVNPSTLTVTLALLAGWNQISIPVQTPTNPVTVFANLPSGWLFYAWEPIQGTYLDKNHASVEVGQGYWLKVNNATSCPVTGMPNLDSETRIPLALGWNMIGTPYMATIAWNQVKISDGISTYFLSTAPAGWIMNTGFHYDGSTYQAITAGSAFQVLFGYWVKTKLAGLSLLFGKP